MGDRKLLLSRRLVNLFVALLPIFGAHNSIVRECRALISWGFPVCALLTFFFCSTSGFGGPASYSMVFLHLVKKGTQTFGRNEDELANANPVQNQRHGTEHPTLGQPMSFPQSQGQAGAPSKQSRRQEQRNHESKQHALADSIHGLGVSGSPGKRKGPADLLRKMDNGLAASPAIGPRSQPGLIAPSVPASSDLLPPLSAKVQRSVTLPASTRVVSKTGNIAKDQEITLPRSQLSSAASIPPQISSAASDSSLLAPKPDAKIPGATSVTPTHTRRESTMERVAEGLRSVRESINLDSAQHLSQAFRVRALLFSHSCCILGLFFFTFARCIYAARCKRRSPQCAVWFVQQLVSSWFWPDLLA